MPIKRPQTAAILLVINGLLMPWIEEVYYRGYLLRRTPGPRWFAVVWCRSGNVGRAQSPQGEAGTSCGAGR